MYSNILIIFVLNLKYEFKKIGIMNDLNERKPNYMMLISSILVIASFVWLVDSHVERITVVDEVDINGEFRFVTKDGYKLTLSFDGVANSKVNQYQNIIQANSFIVDGLADHMMSVLSTYTLDSIITIPIDEAIKQAIKYGSGSMSILYPRGVYDYFRTFEMDSVIFHNDSTNFKDDILCDVGLISEYDKQTYTILTDINIYDFEINIPYSVFHDIKRKEDRRVENEKKKKREEELYTKLDNIKNDKKLTKSEKSKMISYTIELYKLVELSQIKMPRMIIGG